VKGLDLPVLLLYGTGDWITPPVENAAKLRGLFLSPERVEVHVFPDADHRLELDAGRDEDGNWYWPRIAPRLEPTVAAWLRENVTLRGD
jgi:pimeloyl-ACP methyl ester carboxylesterase